MARYSRSQAPWVDEVLTIWMVRLHSASAIYRSLADGGQYTPPGHIWLLLWWSKLAGESYLALRFPSFLGLALVALAVFLLVRRYLAFSVATFAATLVLSGPMHVFGQQIRPYALTVTCFAFAVLLWDNLHRTVRPVRNLVGMGILLSLAITLHYYSILYLVSFAVMELLYSLSTRRFRWPVWLTLFAAGLSVAVWVPLARSISRFNAADSGTNFYAAPTVERLRDSLITLFDTGYILQARVLFLIALLMVVLLIRKRTRDVSGEEPVSSWTSLFCITVGCCLLPLVTFVFARYVSHTYNLRYTLPGALCIVLMAAVAAQFLPYRQVLLPLCSIVIAITSMYPSRIVEMLNNREIVQAATKPYPIVMAEGPFFFQAEEDPALTPEQRSRLTYLLLPAGYRFKDSTSENLTIHWMAILPHFPAFPVEDYLRSRKCFYVFHTGHWDDELSDYLRSQRLQPQNVTAVSGGTLGELCGTGGS